MRVTDTLQQANKRNAELFILYSDSRVEGQTSVFTNDSSLAACHSELSAILTLLRGHGEATRGAKETRAAFSHISHIYFSNTPAVSPVVQ